MITGRYRQNIFGQSGGEYWKDLFCWPTHVVEHGDKIGIVVPTYKSYFFFKYGSKNDDFLGIKAVKRKANGLPAPATRINFSTHVNEAIRLPISRSVCC